VACYACSMQLTVQVERETDGRWIAAVDPIGALAYGRTTPEAVPKGQGGRSRSPRHRLAHGESPLTGRKTRRTIAFEGVRFVA